MKNITIRKRLSLWYTFMIMLFLGAGFSLAYQMFKAALIDRVYDNIARDTAIVADEVEHENGISFFDLDEEEEEALTAGVIYTLYSMEGEWLDGHEAGWVDEFSQTFGEIRKIIHDKEEWLLSDRLSYDDGELVGWVRVLLPMAPVNESVERLFFIGIAGIVPCLIISLLGGLVIAHVALMPVQKITRTARKIGGGDLSTRIESGGSNDEVGQLALAFNEMADNLEASFEREKRFTSDASHEMRTPLTVIMSYADDALKRNDLQTYETAMGVILEKSRHMQDVFSQLLTLARAGEMKDTAYFEKVDIAAIIEDIVDEMREYAAGKRIIVKTELQNNIFMWADQMLLTRMFMNLIDNAVKYGKEDGMVYVKAEQGQNGISISVSDDGIGISEKDIPHIFDRFYRSDKARSGLGSGLGLALVKMITQLHSGEVSVESVCGESSVFYVNFPLKIKDNA